MAKSVTQQPVFKPMRAKFRVAGLSAGAAVAVLSILGIGAALVFALGGVTHEVYTEYNYRERAQIVSDYSLLASQLDSIDKQRRTDGASSYGQMNLSTTQREVVDTCEELGIEPGMSRYELEQIAPEGKVEDVETFPLAARLVLCALVPTAVAYLLLAVGFVVGIVLAFAPALGPSVGGVIVDVLHREAEAGQ